jgi:hypothetical protein
MDLRFEYRSYMIVSEDGLFIAKSLDGEPGEISSTHILRVTRAIDALWSAVEAGIIPQWFSEESLINLDQPVRPARVEKPCETTPSEVDPPRTSTIVLTVLASVVPNPRSSSPWR